MEEHYVKKSKHKKRKIKKKKMEPLCKSGNVKNTKKSCKKQWILSVGPNFFLKDNYFSLISISFSYYMCF